MHTNETDIKYNLCVIGAGPLGIIVTLEYARLNPDKKLLLIEFGEGPEDAENILDKSIAIENTINHHPPNECTNKGFGGTSATWGGRCVMYDEVDFIDRPVLNNGCTWDSGLFKELQEYLPVTAEYFECGNPEFDVNNISEFANTHIAQGFLEGNITDNRLERWSTPTKEFLLVEILVPSPLGEMLVHPIWPHCRFQDRQSVCPYGFSQPPSFRTLQFLNNRVSN